MQFSRKTDYGILFISALKETFFGGDFFTIKEVSKNYELPFAYLEKVAVSLKKSGILEAKRGVGGGYRLKKSPKLINFQEIIEIFEEPEITRCLQEGREVRCKFVGACPTQKSWSVINNKITKIFKKIKISNVI